MSNVLKRNAINKDFSRNPQMHKSRSGFKIANSRKQTMNGSYLVPIFVKQTLPGDTWEMNMSAFARLMPQVAAVMDNAIIKTYFFWERCPNLWQNFTKMMGERRNPNDSIDYIAPAITIPAGGFEVGSLFDYLRIATGRGAGHKINAMIPRMYNRIWNKYFRSEQLQNEVTEKDDDTDDNYTLYTLLKKNKTPDYFTRNLPDTQLGDGVSLPIGTVAPVVGNGKALGITYSNGTATSSAMNLLYTNMSPNSGLTYYGLTRSDVTHATPTTLGAAEENVNASTTTIGKGAPMGVTKNPALSGLVADLSNATMASIISLRQALALQRTLEMDNRNGTRYTEILSGRYGTVVPDAFLNRPVYLGGTAKPMTTLPVTQTSETTSTTPQGNLTGNTIVADGGNVITASFPDFGYIMGLACISVEPQYQQGLPRMYDQFTRYDFFHPEFNGIGDQPTYNSEIFLQDESVVDSEGTPVNNLVFGYNERASEYKTAINEICGELRSEYKESLDVWHYAQKFENLPTLNSQFIQDPAEEVIARSLAVQYKTDEHGNVLDGKDGRDLVYATQCIADFEFSGKVYRGIPVYNLPTIAGL